MRLFHATVGALLLVFYASFLPAADPAPRKLEGHAAAVRAAAYSPDGTLLLTAGDDGKLLVRNKADGSVKRELAIPGQMITALALSGDGKTAVVGTSAASLGKVALPDGEMLDVWGGVPGAVTSLALSQDGRWLISGDAAGYTRLWDLTTKMTVRDFVGAPGAISAVGLSPDDMTVAASVADGGLRAWNRDSGQLIGAYFAPPASTLVHHPKDKTLASGGGDGFVRQWRWPPQPRVLLGGHTDVVPSLGISADGKLALSGGLDGQVLLWSVLEDKVVRPLPGAAGKVTSVALSGDGLTAVAGTEGGTLHFWNAADAAVRGAIVGHKSPITALALDDKSTHVAATYADGSIRWWRAPEAMGKWSAHQAAITHFATSLDRRFVVTCGSDKSIRVWDAATGQVKRAIESLPQAPERSCLSADGTWFAWSDATGRVQVEQTGIGKDTFVVQAGAGPLAGLALIEKGKVLVTAGMEGSLKYWPLPSPSPTEVAKLTTKITASHALPNDRLLVGDEKGVARLLAADGKEEATLNLSRDAITALTLLVDGDTLVASDAKGQLYVASLQGKTQPAAIGGQGVITSVAPHPAEPRFATSGVDGSIRIWKTPQRKSLAKHERPVTALAMSADGKFGVTTDDTGLLHRWNLAEALHDSAISTGEAPITAVRYHNAGGVAVGDALGDVRFVADDAKEVGAVLGTHDAAISQLAYHPTAPFLATASTDGRVRAWNVQNPAATVLARLEHPAVHIAMTSDQGKLFAVCDDGSLAAFDLNANAQAWTKPSLGDVATCLAVSHDNSTLAAGLPNGEVHLFTTLDGTPLGKLGTGYTPVRAIAFRSGSGELATAHDDDVVRVWSLPKPPQVWTDHTGAVSHVGVAAAGPLLASAADDRTVRLWSAADANPGWVLGHAQPILAMALSGDGARLATMTKTSARVWNTADGTLHREWKMLTSPGTAVALSLDGKQLWTGHADGKVSLWNADDGTPIRTLAAHTKKVVSLARAGTTVASTGDDGQLRLWPHDGDQPVWIAAAPAALTALSSDAKGTLLVGRDSKGMCDSWSAANGERKRLSDAEFRAIAIATTGKLLAGDSGRGLELHQAEPVAPFLATGLLERLVHTEKFQGQLAFLNDDLGVVAGDAKGRVLIWRRSAIATNKTTSSRITTLTYLEGRDRPTFVNRAGRIRHFDGSEIAAVPGVDDIVASAATRDGNRVAALGGVKQLVVWDHKQNRMAANIPMPVPGKSVSLSGDGLRAAVVGEDDLVRVWHLEPPRQLRRIGVSEKVVEAMLSTAGDWLAVATADGQVRRYTAADHAEVASHGPGVTACAYWPNGERFLSGGADKYLRFHDRDYKPQGQIGPFDLPVQAIAVRADGGQVLIGDGKQLYVLRGDNLQIERKHEIPGGCVAISYLGTGLNAALACGDQKLRIVQLADARVLEELPCDHATSSIGAFAGPEGVFLLAAGPNNTAVLAKAALERLIIGHQGAVNGVVWAGAGAMLVSGGADKSVRQWNVADGAQQRIYQGHADAVTSVAVSHDSLTIFAAGADKTLRAWPLADPAKQLYAIATPTPVRNLRLASDSTRVYAASDDNDLRALDAVTGRLIEQMPLPAASTALYLAADASHLISIGADNAVRRVPFRCSKLVAADAVKLHDLSPLATDSGVAVSCEDKSIKLFDASGMLLRPLAAPPVAVTHIGVAADGKMLAVAGDAGVTQPSLWAWDPNDGRHLFTLAMPANVASMAVSPEGRIAACLADRRVLIYDQGQLLEELLLPAVATRLQFLNPTTIAALIGDQNVHILKPSCEQRLIGQQGAMNAAAVSPDGKLFTGGGETVLRVWDAAAGKQISSAALPAGMLQLRVSAKGEYVVATLADGKLLRWDAAAFKKEQADPPTLTIQLPIGSRGLSLSADGQRALVGSDDGWLRTFDLTSGKELEKNGPAAAAVLAAVWSPESGRVLASSADKVLARSQLGIAAAHPLSKEPLQALAQTADGNRLAVADATGKIVVVTAADGKVVFEHQLASKLVHRLAWSVDGKDLTAAMGEGAVVIAVK